MFKAGEEIAGYRIERLLGRGGMGVVYEATQLSLDRTVALKVLTPEISHDYAFRARFRREGRIQARIDHSNIVAVHEAGEAEDGLFLAMRYVRGPTLKAMILARELDSARALRILAPVADALDAAHEAGLVHRDVKPQNILVAAGDHPYLADFGLTKSATETAITGSGGFIGTLDYIAPEQIRAEEATARSDIYSFGAVLYECLTGTVPFPMQSQAAVIYAHMTAPPPRVTDQRPDIPPGLDAVVAKALAKQPAERHASVGELMREAFEAFESQAVVAAPPGPLRRARDAGIRADEAQVPTLEAAPVAPTNRMRSVEEHAAVPAPVPMAKPVRRSSLYRALGALAAVIAAGSVLGVAVRHGSGSASAPAASSFVAAGRLSLTPSGSWKRVAGAQIAGLALQDAVILSDRSTGVRQGLAIGMSAARGDPLLPTAFVQRLTARPHGQPVQLGRYSAYRYAGLREGKADRVLTAYAIPTDHGTATVVCFSPAAGSAAFMTRCTRAAGTIGLTGVRAFALGPDPRFAARVNAVLAVFVPARTKILKGFAASKSAAAQAVAATKVANLYASARRRVATGSVSPELAPARQAITDALARTSLAYRALAAAARHQSPPRYRQAAKAVVTAGRRVAASFARLRSLGYRVRSG